MASSPPDPDKQHADLPRIPVPTAALDKAVRERIDYIRLRERLEQRSVFRGLIALALAILLLSLWHAGAGRVFIGRWWWP